MKRIIPLWFATILTPALAFSQVIVDDSWADGGRNNGPDLLDTDWWTSTGSTAIEVSVGSLGLVSGGSGRGIHGTFASQSLGIGDTLLATFVFSTPATVVPNKAAAFRFGLFDTTGKPGLAADISATSGSPNPIYNNLFGYMMDWDVNTGSDDIHFRERSNPASGQLLATTSDFTPLGNGGTTYTFAPSSSYTGVFSVTRTGADSLNLTGKLFLGAAELTSYTATDTSSIVTTFGMLAFHVNSSTFGSSSTPNTPDNGIDFSNIRIELIPVPEPSSAALLLVGALLLGRSLRRKA